MATDAGLTLSGQAPTGPDAGGSRRWAVALAKAALTVALTWLIFRAAGVRLAEAGSMIDWTLVRIDPVSLLASLVALAGAFALQAWLWARLLVQFGGPPVPLGVATSMILLANMGRYVPGKVFQLAGLTLLAKREGVSGVQAGVAAVTGQVLNLLAAAMVGGWAAYTVSTVSEEAGVGAGISTDVGAGLGAGLVVALGVVVLVGFGGAGRMLRWSLRRTGQEGRVALPGRKVLGLCLIGYIAGWALYGLAFSLLARGTGLGIPLATAITAFAGAYLVGYLVLFAPGGIGVREGGLILALAPVLGPQSSLMLAGLQRVWITAGELAGALGGAMVLRARPGTPAGGATPADMPAEGDVGGHTSSVEAP